MSGVICKCGYGMVFNRVLVYSDRLNGNIFCDLEFVCSECSEIKYLRCPMETVLKARRKEDYHPCLERREIIFEGINTL